MPDYGAQGLTLFPAVVGLLSTATEQDCSPLSWNAGFTNPVVPRMEMGDWTAISARHSASNVRLCERIVKAGTVLTQVQLTWFLERFSVAYSYNIFLCGARGIRYKYRKVELERI
jgi:hypothetical protein